MPGIEFTKLPFKEAQDFLRQKVSLPTKTWRDIQDGMHSRAFVIAGAQKTELLGDIRASLQKALDEGKTLNDFKKDFRKTVQAHGWNYKGSEGWRTGVIFNTNMRTAFSAGNEAQLQRTKKTRPYARYLAGLSAEPRPEHLGWHGTILPIDHSWWSTHTPQNGWGCKCKKVSVSLRELLQNNWKVSKNSPTSASSKKGIDESFFYNPGQAAWGQQASLESMRDFKEDKSKFEILSQGDWESEGRPDAVPEDSLKARVDRKAVQTQQGMETALNKILKGEEKIFTVEKNDFRYDYNVNGKALAEHLKDSADRAPFLPLINDVLQDPYEVWQTFQRHKGSGKVVLRTRFIKAVKSGQKGKGMLFVADAANGQMEGLTLIPMRNVKALNKERRGKLVYGRKK